MYILDAYVSEDLALFLGKTLNLIHIAAPILLIVFVTIDLIKAILSQDNEIVSKTVRSIKNRTIACIMIFFLPTIVEVIFTQASVTLNLDKKEYEDILSTYKSVINSENIKVGDKTQTTDISSNLLYTLESKEKKDDTKKEELLTKSKVITKYIFTGLKFQDLALGFSSDDLTITYDGKTYSINDRLNISYQSLFARDVVDNGDYVIATVTFKNATINNTKVDSGSISYFYSKETDKYLLEKINIETSKSISDFTSKTKTSEKPDEINASSKFASTNPEYNYDKLNNLKESDISKIYEANKENIVMLNTISNQATVNRATGFFISDGVIATSWSYLENSFMIGDTIIVSDVLNNTYKCVGLVAMDTENDIAVIKLDKKSGTHVKFGDKTNLSINDPIITITSKTGVGLSSLVGIVSSVNDNLINVLPLEKNDWGSAVFNTDGYVVGINNSKLLNSELSNASSIDTLKTLSAKLKNTKLKDIKATSLEEVKSKYYYKEKNKEEIKKLVDTKIWNKYKSIGNIENTIALNLVKASYYNDTLSLRYENNTSKYIDTLSYVEDFTTTLTNQGYTLKYKSGENTRLMYAKGRDKVVITEEFDYLIILLVRGRVL